MPVSYPQVQGSTFRPFSVTKSFTRRPGLPSNWNHGLSIRCSSGGGAAGRGKPKSGRQQRADAADTAKRGIDDAAENLKSGVRSAEGAIDAAADSAEDALRTAEDALNSPRQPASDTAADARIGARFTAADADSAVSTAVGAAGSQRKSAAVAADAAREGIDDAAVTANDALRSAEDALDNPRQAVSDTAADARSGARDAVVDAKSVVSDAEDAAGAQRKSVAAAADAARDGIDAAAEGVETASRRAQEYAADPEAAVDDAADAVSRGIDAAAEGVEQGIDQAQEYAEDPKLAAADAADAAKSGVDDIADNLKAGVRAARQGIADGADAAEEAAEDTQMQSQPRVGARPVTVSFSSGAGTAQEDTTTSSGPGEAQAVVGEGAADAARQVEAQADFVADALEQGIDDVAKQASSAIEAAGETVEGIVDDAPRQTAAVLQQAVDSTADTINRARSTAAAVSEDFEELQAPGPAAPFATTPLTSMPSVAPEKDDVDYLKKRLLFSVAGLDRGFAANESAALAVETAIYSLVGAAGGSPPLTWSSKEGSIGGGMEGSTLGMLSGTWRLVYSSGFASGSLGGLRPGPQAALLPITIGQVYQVISTATATLDNCVEFYVRNQLPSLPGLPPAEPIVSTLRLRHSLEILPGSNVQITFEDTQVNVTGGLGGVLGKLPEFSVPQLPEPLKPSRALRSSVFEVLFLDADLRVTRGDRGELRVFVRT